ncbi:MAG: hypothetical protein PVI86_19170 [Phycisphaerae bacterium]
MNTSLPRGRGAVWFGNVGRASSGFAAALCCLAVGVAANAEPAALTAVVPQEAVAAYFSPKPTDVQPQPGSLASTVGVIGFMADRAQDVGLLSGVDECSRMWIDSFACFSTVLDYPFAIALLDVASRPRTDGGHELASLRLALVCRTGGENDRLDRRIQHLLNTYTNGDDTRLSSRALGRHTVFSLKDRRLPPWLSIGWGQVGEYYVLGLGDGAVEQTAATIADRSKSLAHDDWFKQAFAQAHGTEASASWYVRFDGLTRGSDASFGRKVGAVQEALRLGGVERGLWTVRFADRALEIDGVRRRGGVDEVTPIASRRFLTKLHDPVIPDEATGYTVIDCEPQTVLKGIADAVLASKSPGARQSTLDLWGRLAAGAGVSIHEDIMSQLGSPVVIHNHPRHALRLPLAWTILVRVDGDAGALRTRIDQWLANAQKELPEENLLKIRRTEDDIWYIQYGLMGPGLGMTDKWLVVSFSPYAVRQNLEFLSPKSVPVSASVEERVIKP